MENASTEFIDVHGYNRGFESALDSFKRDEKIIPKNKELILRFVEDARKGKTVKTKAKKRIGPARCMKCMYTLRKLSEWFGKPFDEITEDDVERVIECLEEDKFKINRGKTGNYSENTKLDFKKILKKFFKWLFGETEKYFELTNWIDTHEEILEVPALTREEIERMANACKTREKALIMFLFDSGARIGELLNVRIGDLTKKDEENYYMVRIKHSKTKPRTVSVPMCTQYLTLWLSVHPDKENPNAPLFSMGYDTVRMFLKRTGKEVLKKDVYPHLLRHSSATYYCNKLNQYQLCYRYGWAMSSKQPARYIDREGIHEQKTAEIIQSDEITKVKKENQKIKEDFTMLKTDFDKSEGRRRVLEKQMRMLNELVLPIAKNEEELKTLAGTIARLGLREKARVKYNNL